MKAMTRRTFLKSSLVSAAALSLPLRRAQAAVLSKVLEAGLTRDQRM
jgi:hypothetical protein